MVFIVAAKHSMHSIHLSEVNHFASTQPLPETMLSEIVSFFKPYKHGFQCAKTHKIVTAHECRTYTVFLESAKSTNLLNMNKPIRKCPKSSLYSKLQKYERAQSKYKIRPPMSIRTVWLPMWATPNTLVFLPTHVLIAKYGHFCVLLVWERTLFSFSDY